MRRLVLLPPSAAVLVVVLVVVLGGVVGCGAEDRGAADTLPPILTTTTDAVTTTTLDPRDRRYIVQAGDNLSEIARRYQVTVASIVDLNRLASEVIQPGQELKIPNIRIDLTLPPLPGTTEVP